MIAALRKYQRPVMYAAILVLGMSIAFNQLESGYQRNFFTVILIISLVLIIEIYSTWLFYQLQRRQTRMVFTHNYEQWLHWIHHMVLPVIAYVSSCIFIYYNRGQSLRWLLYAVTFVVFAVLFFNLRSYFEHDMLDEQLSHYIYDVIKIYLFFLVNNVLLEFFTSEARQFFVPLLIIILGTTFSLLSITRRRQLKQSTALLCLLIGNVLGFVNLVLLTQATFTPLKIAVFSLAVYYFGNAMLHHYLDKTLKSGILIEYLIVLVLIANILINLH